MDTRILNAASISTRQQNNNDFEQTLQMPRLVLHIGRVYVGVGGGGLL